MSALDALVCSTELDAVNIMLRAIGEQPVSSLEESGLSDVAIAKTTLAEVSRDIQAKGWDFNTDLNYALALSTDGTCSVPTNALRIDTTWGKSLVWRAGKLWDRRNNTFVLDSAPKCDIVRYLSFEDCPESFRYYAAVRAARIFQATMLGDEGAELFTEKQEAAARANFEDAEGSSADRNILHEAEISGMVRTGRSEMGPSGLGDPRII